MSISSMICCESTADEQRNAGVLAGWLAGVPRLRSAKGGEDAAWTAAETAALPRFLSFFLSVAAPAVLRSE